MTGTEGANEVMTHLTTGAVIVYAIEWLKSQGWFPWVTSHSTAVNRIIAGGAAVIIALGITITGDAGTGWTMTIPPLATLTSLGWEAVKQYVMQQVIYDGVVQKSGAHVTVVAAPAGPVGSGVSLT